MSKRDIISKNILALRKKAGLTQAELADKLNYSDKAISKWERGESLPDAEMLYSIATLFHVEIGYLFEEHEEVELPKEDEQEFQSREKKARFIFAIVLASVIIAIIGIAIISMGVTFGWSSNTIWLIFIFPVIIAIVLGVELISGMRPLFSVVLSSFVWSVASSVVLLIEKDNNRGHPISLWIYMIALVLQIGIIIYPRLLKGIREGKNKKLNERLDKIELKPNKAECKSK